MTLRIAIVGDHGMHPDYFAAALRRVIGEAPEIRTMELGWPDVPMIQAHRPGVDPDHLRGLREFLGTPEEVLEIARGCAVFITHIAPLSGEMLDALPDLKLIAISRGGPINIDVAAARQRGIAIVNAPGRNASAVAEFTVGLILSQTRNITRSHADLSAGRWRGDLYRIDLVGDELCELVVGLIGYSHIGRRVAQLLRPFGCRILISDPYVELSAADQEAGIQKVGLDELLDRCDVVSLHARVTPETRGMIGAPQIARMKRNAYLINTARGELVDYRALEAALETGRLGGAALDTFDAEPPDPRASLLGLRNVTLTPHISGASIKTVRYSAEMIAREVDRFLKGQPLVNVCG
ncbi:MAG TPA: 2-hydroxyacid dehydrogenase [Aliidongia sp.]|uniref:2-hydroxyacid dehydrogenase n=1 Tax=Aliidongia sp. TaxID=1914230 RepID=UPI002DDCC69C|nr:2-hydroxyacid dehydrogenase [Aliidongia sp.]HEV2677690.1 2-hydroxyacid dehydrogenase [Aliidongia sp.]